MAEPTELDVERAAAIVVVASTAKQANLAIHITEGLTRQNTTVVTPSNPEALRGYGANALFIVVHPFLPASRSHSDRWGQLFREIIMYEALYNNVRRVHT